MPQHRVSFHGIRAINTIFKWLLYIICNTSNFNQLLIQLVAYVIDKKQWFSFSLFFSWNKVGLFSVLPGIVQHVRTRTRTYSFIIICVWSVQFNATQLFFAPFIAFMAFFHLNLRAHKFVFYELHTAKPKILLLSKLCAHKMNAHQAKADEKQQHHRRRRHHQRYIVMIVFECFQLK